MCDRQLRSILDQSPIPSSEDRHEQSVQCPSRSFPPVRPPAQRRREPPRRPAPRPRPEPLPDLSPQPAPRPPIENRHARRRTPCLTGSGRRPADGPGRCTEFARRGTQGWRSSTGRKPGSRSSVSGRGCIPGRPRVVRGAWPAVLVGSGRGAGPGPAASPPGDRSRRVRRRRRRSAAGPGTRKCSVWRRCRCSAAKLASGRRARSKESNEPSLVVAVSIQVIDSPVTGFSIVVPTTAIGRA
jgi:hypothetical protein